MKYKTGYTQKTSESSSQTSSGVTMRLSLADGSPLVPGVSIFGITDMSNYIRCLFRDPGAVQRRLNNRTVFQCMLIILRTKKAELCPDVHRHLARGLLTILFFFLCRCLFNPVNYIFTANVGFLVKRRLENPIWSFLFHFPCRCSDSFPVISGRTYNLWVRTLIFLIFF